MRSLRNWILFIVVILFWGLNWSVKKVGLLYVDPLNMVFQRFLFSALAISPVLYIYWNKIPRDKRNLLKLFLLGTIGTLNEIVVNMGLILEKSGIAAILTYTQPFFVFLFAVLFLGEKAKLIRFVGILMGFFGVYLLSNKGILILENFSPSIIFFILGAILWAISIIFYKKFLSHVDPLITSIFQFSTAAIITAPTVLVSSGFSFPLSSQYLMLILYCSIPATAVATTIWLLLLREEKATTIASSSLAVPMIAFIFGSLLLGENIELNGFLATFLIIIGLYLVNRTE